MKSLLLLLILSSFASCASRVPTVYPEEKGTSCYTTEELSQEKKRVCLRVNSFRDPVRWHGVQKWHVMPSIPDLP